MRSSHVDSPRAVGARLRGARLEAGLTQGALAFPGCSVGYVSRLEAGLRTPSLQVVHELASRLGVDERWLARGTTIEPEASALLLDAELALRLDELEEVERLIALAEVGANETRAHARIAAIRGKVAFRQGDATRTIEELERAFQLDIDLDDASAADTLGRAYARLDDTEAATQLFRRWIRRSQEQGNTTERFRFSVLLANALIDDGGHGEAAELLADLLDETDGGDPLALARLHWSQARLHGMKADGQRFRQDALRALTLLEATEHTYYRARAHHLLAYAHLDEGDWEAATELLERGLDLLGKSPSSHDVAEFRLELARARAMGGDPDGALELATSARELLSLDAHSIDLARCDIALAEAFDAKGRGERARDLFIRAVELLEKTPGASRYHVDAYTRFAAHLERCGETTQALQLYKRAALIAQGGRLFAPDHSAVV